MEPEWQAPLSSSSILPDQDDFPSLVCWPNHWQPESLELVEKKSSNKIHSFETILDNPYNEPLTTISLVSNVLSTTNPSNELEQTDKNKSSTPIPIMRQTLDEMKRNGLVSSVKSLSAPTKTTPFDHQRSARSVLEQLVFVFPDNVRRLLVGSKK